MSPDKSYFIKILFRNVKKELEEEISSLCFDYKAMGISEKLDFEPQVYPAPKVLEKPVIDLCAYFESIPEELLAEISQKFPEIETQIEKQENQDWMEEWKKGFHAFHLVDRFWVVPSWEEASQKDIEPLYIDPGMAFGTGTHETTQICSQLLFEILSSKENILSMIDVGTGTGILALIAHKMGVSRILGVDNDPEAIRVAQENLEKNKISFELSSKSLNQLNEKFDLVVANIIDGILLKLKEQLISKLDSNGVLVLSGILEENDEEFIKGFLAGTSLVAQKRIQKGEWIGYILNLE